MQYAVSDTGTLVYMPGRANAAGSGRTLVWVDKEGKEEPLKAPLNAYHYPSISPDATRVALTVGTVGASGNANLWIWDLVRETLTRLTFSKLDLVSIWTPDSKGIVFMSVRDGKAGVYRKAADGTGQEEPLGSVPKGAIFPYSWSSDGKTLVMGESEDLATKFDISTLSMEGERKFKPLLHEEYAEIQPKISPDGRWMAYTSSESGKNEIYVRPFPDVNKGRWQVSTNGGDSPLWSQDGHGLFYLDGDSVVSVSVETEPTFKPGNPKVLFRGTYVRSYPADGTPWDISPDGKRFLMMKEPGTVPSAAVGPRKINIVLNWLEELKQRVPVK
jgi:serine/threonine-protein kinase